ncbi:DUF2238 domain-containing protein [Thiomicrorhabdus sediminis]|uniref:DUF2238 domain-containing protein n=2 Tax=Thiomicrorhabdus sediminis TaxID=2580412 RepID=A0A4P9KA14_9GAMM|nr:DUF2238 domain-containing protein [Thiomicrorhabdus sediminis]
MINWLWLIIFFSVFSWSAYKPFDGYTWFLEVLPAIIALFLLVLSRKKFPLTPLLYLFILLHCIVLMIGGHYTYAEVPLFDDIAIWMGSERNNYDKLGHFFQGLVPAMLAIEILIRLEVVKSAAWIRFFSVCIALAISAFYELIEWWVALLSEQAAESFLGTQGYVWDTQSDMAMALFGAMVAIILFYQPIIRQIQQLKRGDLAER